MNEEHTPTPWVATDTMIRYLSESGAILADCEFFGVQGKANAAFIISAVNAHEELVGALKVYRKELMERATKSGDKATLQCFQLVDEILGRAGVPMIAKAEGSK